MQLAMWIEAMWLAAGAMGVVALACLALALWRLAELVHRLEAQLMPEAQQVVGEAHRILAEAKAHVGLVAEATGRAEALMAAAEPSVERLAQASEAGAKAAQGVALGLHRTKGWLQVAAVATAAAWRSYREGPGEALVHAPASSARPPAQGEGTKA